MYPLGYIATGLGLIGCRIGYHQLTRFDKTIVVDDRRIVSETQLVGGMLFQINRSLIRDTTGHEYRCEGDPTILHFDNGENFAKLTPGSKAKIQGTGMNWPFFHFKQNIISVAQDD